MTSSWSSTLSILALSVLPAAAQSQLPNQIGLQAMVLTAEPTAGIFGGYAALSFGSRLRLAVTAGAGLEGSSGAFRLEALGHFRLTPEGRKWGWYLGGGVAYHDGVRSRGLLVALIGWDYAVGAGSMVLEGGVGGGGRIAAGYRWKLPRSDPGR